jgi:iron complex outermembrane receptor protein
VLGAQWRSERIQSLGLYNTDATYETSFARLHGNLEWQLAPNWLLNAGVMTEKDCVSGDSLAPRLMFNWHATSAQTWRAGISKAFRPPSTFEDFASIHYIWNDPRGGPFSFNQTLIQGPGNLRPEAVVAREIGYLGDFADVRLNLNARLFHEGITDFIRQVNSGPARTYANDENFVIKGLEYQMKWEPWQDAQFVFNQSYTDISSPHEGTATAAPRLASSIAYFQKLPDRFDLSLMHTDTSAASLLAESTPVPIRRTDLRLAKGVKWGNYRGEISLVVQNLGPAYSDYKSNYLFERQAFVTLRLHD